MNPEGIRLDGVFVRCGSAGKESTCNAGDLGSIPGLGRSRGEGKRYSLQCPGLENSKDHIVHGVAESYTTERFSLSLILGGVVKLVRLSPPLSLLDIPLYLSPGSQLPLRLWLPRGTKGVHEECYRLKDIFCNYNTITLANRHLNSQGLGLP